MFDTILTGASVTELAGLGALITAAIAAVGALTKIGPERQTTMVGAQDTVIDNLREEVDRQRKERVVEIRELELRHQRQIDQLHREMEEDAKRFQVRIAELQARIEELERAQPDGSI